MKSLGAFCVWLWFMPTMLAQDAVLQATITDAATHALSPCTIAITDATGKLLLENDSFKAGFRCLGTFRKRLPPGPTRVRVTRGFETQFVERELNLAPGETASLSFTLQRNVDLRKFGWYGGDSHAHMLHGERTLPVSFDFVAETAQAEDLQYLCLAQAWQIDNPTPEALEAYLRPRSTRTCVLTWNLEAPKNYYKGDAGRCLGHCWNLGMRGQTKEGKDVIKVLMDASAWDYESDKPTFANFESHRLIHEQGGAVFYTHPARWWTGSWGGKGDYAKVNRMRVSNMAVELPLDTVLGPTFDGLDVITGPGEFEANDKAFELWVMLLNHGYRLAATGSSDACFDRPGGAGPGTPRTYSYLPHGFSIGKITRATRDGHTFVTTGPLLLASLDGQPPGSAFKTGQARHELAIEAWASGQETGGLDRLEILRNGEPFRVYSWPDHPASARTNLNFVEESRSWYCARLWGSDAKKQRAITSAFYFGTYAPPPPVRANLHARLLNAGSNALLNGSLVEITYAGTLARPGKRHQLRTGDGQLIVPGTVRLRAEVAGYEPVELSPVFDVTATVIMITGLTDTDLLDWTTFERMRQQLATVDLEFKLRKSP